MSTMIGQKWRIFPTSVVAGLVHEKDLLCKRIYSVLERGSHTSPSTDLLLRLSDSHSHLSRTALNSTCLIEAEHEASESQTMASKIVPSKCTAIRSLSRTKPTHTRQFSSYATALAIPIPPHPRIPPNIKIGNGKGPARRTQATAAASAVP
jgi:hypothetical protein